MDKITIDGTEYELIEVSEYGNTILSSTPHLSFGGKRYVGKAIPKGALKDYEVKSCIGNYGEIVKWQGIDEHGEYNSNKKWLDGCLLYKYKIHSVERLSDNTIFSIGDKIDQGKITEFILIEDKMCASFENQSYSLILEVLTNKERKPLFYADNGVTPIYIGDKYWYVESGYIIDKALAHHRHGYYSDYFREKTFSTEEKAKEHILFNNNILNLNDLLDCWQGEGYPQSREHYKSSDLFKRFENKAKKKLNQ